MSDRYPGEGEADFDLIARPYRWLEYLALGPALQRTRTEFIPLLQDRRRALLLGDGDGRFLAALLADNRLVSADAVDTSATMLSLLSRRTKSCGSAAQADQPAIRVRTHLQNALAYVPDFVPDLIVTHFFLDCLTQDEVERLVRRLAPAMAPGGLWLVSEFCVPGGPVRHFARVYVRMLYVVFRWVTGLRVSRLPDYGSALAAAGLIRIACRNRCLGLLTSQLWRREG